MTDNDKINEVISILYEQGWFDSDCYMEDHNETLIEQLQRLIDYGRSDKRKDEIIAKLKEIVEREYCETHFDDKWQSSDLKKEIDQIAEGTCLKCNGTGYLSISIGNHLTTRMETVPCRYCNGNIFGLIAEGQ